MPLRAEKDRLAEEIRAFLRSESATRKTWQRRAWLGRRAAFAALERVILSNWWSSMRANRRERWYFVDRLLDALEHAEALDVMSAGELAQAVHEDPVSATAANERGQESPFAADELALELLNNPRPKR